jgi:hypothetical protein
LDDARRLASFPYRVLRRRRPAEGWCPRSESTRPKPGPLCPRPEPAACPSWGCSASQRIRVPIVGTYWFGPALHVLGPPKGSGPRGLPTGTAAQERRSPSASRSQASAPLQGQTIRPCQWPKPKAPLVGFGPLRRISSREVRSTRGSHTRHLPTTGFLTLLPDYSLPGRVGLFHPTNAHGV